MAILRFLRKRQAPTDGSEDGAIAELSLKLEQASGRFKVPQASKDGSRERMTAALSAARAEGRAVGPVAPRVGGRGFVRVRRLGFAGAIAAFLLVVTAGGLGVLDPADTPLGSSPTAEAFVVEGTLESQSAAGLTLNTAAGSRVLQLESGVAVLDSVGNLISLEGIVKGEVISVRGRHDRSSGLVVSEIKAIKEIHGRVISFDGSLLRLTSANGDFEIVVTSGTEIEGLIGEGVAVEVEVERSEGGVLIAEEVEVEDDDRGPEAGHDGDDDHDSSGPGGGDDNDR